MSRIKRIRAHALVFGLLMLTFVFGACGSEATITILHFADLHDNLLPLYTVTGDQTTETGGIARLIGTIKKERELSPETTRVLFAGDAIEGTHFSIFYKGNIVYKFFDGLIDYGVFGVHDFDYTLENLLSLTKNARYKMLAANTFDRDAKPFTGYDCVVEEIDGVKVGIFGLSVRISEDLQTLKNLGYGSLQFTDVEEAAKDTIQRLRQQGAEVIIALTHQGLEDDKTLARAVEDLDLHLIVGGRSHTNLPSGFQTFETKIVQAGFRGEHLGKVVIRYDRNKKEITSITPTLIPITDSSPIDEEVEAIVKTKDEEMQTMMAEILGSTDVLLEGSREVVRGKETNLANFIADAMRKESGADICLINAGLIRASINSDGHANYEITIKDVLNVLPYSNSLTVVSLPGRAIYRMLEKSAACNPGEGRFLHVSGGLVYKIRGRVLADLRINGREIDFDRTYTVATTDFLAAGGDNYTEFSQNLGSRPLGTIISACVMDFLRAARGSKVNPMLEGRIVRLED